MFYRYEFIKHRRFRELYFHFLYFIKKLKDVRANSRFVPKNYFHASFLNIEGEIAPNGMRNDTIKDAFKNFFDAYKKIDGDKKEEFYQLVLYSQKLKLILENLNQVEANKLHIDYLNGILNDNLVLKKLMDVLWSNLKTNAWEIDAHYDKFYKKLPDSKMCPFCALKKLIDSDLGKEDYDHLLYKAKYPLTSICDNNIAPACSDCNRRFKNIEDILFNTINRRLFKYPFVMRRGFEIQNLLITLDGSTHPETNLANYNGEWIVNISPNDDFNQSWFDIYKIKTRYESHLKNDYKKWIKELINSARIDNNNETSILLKIYINKYKKTFESLEVEYPLKWAYYDYMEKNMSDDLHNYMERIAI
ncbi:hypothetical protein [Flavobacterium sp. ABG]|uniref:hypothetical protein n=1 Tax=Flavobacterium sp. ABG TaxID=1423322 RepID=UPI00064B3859|nr:hypothetical protein [Flavobacterium sp. ABG]KLT69618.1 hypothetical protein AB674_11790 [Flavobacterium sp. ABG]